MKRILVRAPNWIGDQILSFPFFYELRRAFPKAWITSACSAWVEPLQFRNLVNEVIVLPKPTDPSLGARRIALAKGVAQLRARELGWELGFALPPSFSAAWLLWRARVATRVGYRGDGRWSLLTHAPKPASTVRHRAQEYLDLLRCVLPPEHAIPRAQDFWPQPGTPELAEFKEADGRPGVLARFDAALAWPDYPAIQPPHEENDPQARYWVLAPGSVAESRRWGADRFAELARIIKRETGLRGVIVGGPAEAPLAQTLVADRSLQLSDWTAQGAASTLSRVFAEAEFTVANDSGLAHLASLAGSPTCIVWGAGDPARTAPIGPGRTRVVLSSPECWPCERNLCVLEGEQKLQCLKAIDPETVWGEIRDGLLRRSGKAAAARGGDA